MPHVVGVQPHHIPLGLQGPVKLIKVVNLLEAHDVRSMVVNLLQDDAHSQSPVHVPSLRVQVLVF